MKIRIKATGAIRDCSQDVGLILIETGQADALSPKDFNDFIMRKHEPHSLPYHDVTWSTQTGEEVLHLGALHQYAPVLIWHCNTCQHLTYLYPCDKPAELSVFHFQQQECPPDVAAQYLALFQKWVNRKNKVTKGPYQLALDNAFKAEDRRLERLKAGAAVTI